MPVGYKGPRASILVELKLAPGLTAKELAGRLGLSLNAIRHHLRELEVDGLLAHERQQRGVGAPVFAYRLSAAGEQVFPRRYESALTDVLETLVEREGREAVVGALEAWAAGEAARILVGIFLVAAAVTAAMSTAWIDGTNRSSVSSGRP